MFTEVNILPFPIHTPCEVLFDIHKSNILINSTTVWLVHKESHIIATFLAVKTHHWSKKAACALTLVKFAVSFTWLYIERKRNCWIQHIDLLNNSLITSREGTTHWALPLCSNSSLIQQCSMQLIIAFIDFKLPCLDTKLDAIATHNILTYCRIVWLLPSNAQVIATFLCLQVHPLSNSVACASLLLSFTLSFRCLDTKLDAINKLNKWTYCTIVWLLPRKAQVIATFLCLETRPLSNSVACGSSWDK